MVSDQKECTEYSQDSHHRRMQLECLKMNSVINKLTNAFLKQF